MLSDIPSHKKTNRVQFHLCEVPREVKFIEAESSMGVARGSVKDRAWGACVQ